MRFLPLLFIQRLVLYVSEVPGVHSNLQPRENLASHRGVEGVEFLGSVELNAADAVDRVEQNIIALIAGEFFGNIRSSRHLTIVSK